MSEPKKRTITIGELAAILTAIAMVAIAIANWSRVPTTIIIDRQKAAQKAAMDAAAKSSSGAANK